MSRHQLRFEKVSFWYQEGKSILSDIHLTIEEGEILCLIGGNGVGKSTFLKLGNGLLKPSSGNVLIDDMNTKNTRTSQISKNISVSFQISSHHFFAESVEEELEAALKFQNIDPDTIRDRIKDITEVFRLEKISKRNPYSLSGGEKRRLSLAIVESMDPQFYLLDEPTSGQDTEGRKDLCNFLFSGKKNGKSFVIASHDLDFVLSIADRVILLESGHILFDGVPNTFLQSDLDLSAISSEFFRFLRKAQELSCESVGPFDLGNSIGIYRDLGDKTE